MIGANGGPIKTSIITFGKKINKVERKARPKGPGDKVRQKTAKRPKVFFLTYGCTFNAADTDAIKESAKAGNAVAFAKSEADADVVVINTCSVKDATQQKILYKARQLEDSGKKLVMTGCLAQVSPELVEKAAPKASIIGIWSNSRMVDAIDSTFHDKKIIQTKKTGALPFNVSVDGVFARVQVSRGCLGCCTYCSTRLARGRLESFPPETILAGVAAAVRMGAKEIQLTGQDVACYGFDFANEGWKARERENLATLVEKICKIPGRFRVRIGMGNPEHLGKIRESLAKAMESEKVYKFLHIPAQSGSDSVLKRMGRGYTTREYEKIAAFFRKKIPGVTIETDIIVGFPGETQRDFEKTLELIKRTRPQITNVSKYSQRPKTVAARMRQVEKNAIKERSRIASGLCKRIALEENARMKGRKMTVLVTEKARNFFSARAQNYKTVLLERGPVGAFLQVRITGFGQSHLRASRAKPE